MRISPSVPPQGRLELIFIYVIAFVMSARSLIRACGGNGILAVLAAPAAYSMVMEYGFLTDAICYPMTFWLWALVTDLFMDDGATARRSAVRVVAIALATGLIAITHPFAALLAGLGAGFVAITCADRASWARAGLAVAGHGRPRARQSVAKLRGLCPGRARWLRLQLALHGLAGWQRWHHRPGSPRR